METQTAMPQILAHEVARLKRVEFLEARLQTRSFHSFGTGHRCIPPQAPRAGLLKRELRPFIFALTVRARSEDTPPMLKVVEKQDAREVDAELLLPDEIARVGARAHGTSGSKTIGSALCRVTRNVVPAWRCRFRLVERQSDASTWPEAPETRMAAHRPMPGAASASGLPRYAYYR